MMMDEKSFEAEVTRALEQKPSVAVPVDFAARVKLALPAQPKVRAGRFAGQSVGQIAAVVGAVGLFAGLCLLAPHARPSFESLAFDLEMVLLVELGGVVVWLGRAKGRE